MGRDAWHERIPLCRVRSVDRLCDRLPTPSRRPVYGVFRATSSVSQSSLSGCVRRRSRGRQTNRADDAITSGMTTHELSVELRNPRQDAAGGSPEQGLGLWAFAAVGRLQLGVRSRGAAVSAGQRHRHRGRGWRVGAARSTSSASRIAPCRIRSSGSRRALACARRKRPRSSVARPCARFAGSTRDPQTATATADAFSPPSGSISRRA